MDRSSLDQAHARRIERESTFHSKPQDASLARAWAKRKFRFFALSRVGDIGYVGSTCMRPTQSNLDVYT